MSDSAARQFIADEEKMHGRSPTGPVREVYLNARIQIPPIQPKVTISRTSSKIHEGRLAPTQVVVEFAGQIQEISVTKMLPSYTYNNDPIAILHPDAGSNPAPPGGGAAVPVVGARLPDNPVLSPSAAGQAAPAPYLQSETDPHLSPSEATEFEQKAMELYWKKQYQLAFSLSLKACSSGNQDACALEGLLYAFGLGISPDTRLAKTLMTGSCEAGDSKGCDALGSALLKGVPADSRGASIEKDPQKAIELFTNSCKGGYFDACVNLAQIYLYGIGAGQDALKASENLDQACKVGYEDLVAPCEGAFPEACRILSRCYSRGVGVKQDRGKAIQLLNQGCSKGDKASCNDTLDLR
jgi:TPR repeat protein